MRIAVFSDVHANLEALDAFIDHSRAKRVHYYVCLGDIVGYGANPNKCIRKLKAMPGIRFILGNHDNAALGGANNMNSAAGQALSWTRERLSRNSRVFLRSMKENIKRKKLLFCHANPCGVSDWYYIAEKSGISRSFSRTRAKMLFAGHTHAPAVITRKDFFCVYIRRPENGAVVPAATLKRQIFNCGSIGQPRDGDPRSSYLVYDTEKKVVEFHRVAYDYGSAAQKILAAGLPSVLALRLGNGE